MPWVTVYESEGNQSRVWDPQCFPNQDFSDELCEYHTPDHEDPFLNNYRNYENYWEWVQIEVDLDDERNRSVNLTGNLKRYRKNKGYLPHELNDIKESNLSLLVIVILIGIYFLI